MNVAPAQFDEVLDRAAALAECFAAAGHRLFLVGGIVRDRMLGLAGHDADLDATTAARPEEIKRIIADLADDVWSQGERFGTIGCTIAGQPYEITTHRAESYDDHSRKPTVSFGDDIGEDLVRRDFTVNAMAIDVVTRELVDPHGGRADLEAGVLRTPLDPEISFSEDPLRMLRAARFHAGYDLAPVPELEAAITTLRDRMAIVSVERIRDETQKLLLLDNPGPGLALLARTGLLARVLPDLLADAEVIAGRVGAVPPDPAMRWAALLSEREVEPGVLRDLVFSGRLASDTVWFWSAPLARSATGFGAPDSLGALRRAAAAAPRDRRLEDRFDYVAGIRAVNGWPNGPLVSLRRRLAALREMEPDLDDPAPFLSGGEIADLLELDEGPEIGEAVRWLRDLRFDRGPIDVDEAARRLQAWWPIRDLD